MISIIITTFNRPQLLKWHLYSLARQEKVSEPYEVLIMNDGLDDDETKNLCEKYKDSLNLRYIFTGKRNSKNNTIWRVPGFAFNIGVKKAAGEFIILSCAEIFHLSNNTINLILASLKRDPNHLASPDVVDDERGAILNHLEQQNINHPLYEIGAIIASQKDLIASKNQDRPLVADWRMPYFMGITKKHYVDIGGFDEDFIGIGADDNDFRERLLSNGCQHDKIAAIIVHLFHGIKDFHKLKTNERYIHNCKIWKQRQGIIKRNLGKNWGEI